MNIAITLMLTICVLTVAVCAISLVLVSDVFNRMHYLAPMTSLSIIFLLIAVVIQEGWSQAALKTVLVVFVLFLVNAVLTHQTARAARIREFGHWVPQPKEHIKGAGARPSDSPVQ